MFAGGGVLVEGDLVGGEVLEGGEVLGGGEELAGGEELL